MKNQLLIVSVILLLLGFSACCGDCNRTFVGQFLLPQAPEDPLKFAENTNRLFNRNGQQTEVFTYSNPVFSLDRVPFNCMENGNCGTCCDEYETESAFLEFTSSGGELKFNISLQKDFITHAPTDPINEVGEFFSITMNNSLTGELFLDNPSYLDRVTVNGEEFRNVFEALADPATLDSTKRDPAAFYFLPGDGIVAFRLANGEEWSL